jgi:hypothetical protein
LGLPLGVVVVLGREYIVWGKRKRTHRDLHDGVGKKKCNIFLLDGNYG